MGIKVDPNNYLEGNYDGENFSDKMSQIKQDVSEAKKIASEVAKLYEESKKKEDDYLVDGAILQCNQATIKPFKMSDGTVIPLQFSGDEINDRRNTEGAYAEYKQYKKRQRLYTQLHVNNSKVLTGVSQHATVVDSKKGVNIMPFRCHCKLMDDLHSEYEEINAHLDECKKEGVCKYLMRLNDTWENWLRDTKDFCETRSLTVISKDGSGREELVNENVSCINMRSMIFCKHGGLITPVASGQDEFALMRFKYDWKKKGLPSSQYVTDEFLLKVLEIADKLGVRPDDLMAVMAWESWLNPHNQNPNPSSTATGLLQFVEAVANKLGTSTQKLLQMSAVEQLEYVYAYLKPAEGHLDTVEDIYTAVLDGPETINEHEDGILFDTSDGDAYTFNKELDVDDDGKITKEEAAEHVRKRREEFGRKEK